jgi:hypothetical protein
LAKTHSPLSFNELLKEALGSGLQPWEFYEYNLDEYISRREGLYEKRKSELREIYTHVQMLAYYSVSPYLSKSDKKKPINDIIPNIYEEQKPKPSAKEAYKKLIDQYKAQGLLN